ncbi:hypothetical protein IMG5_103520 [Ichthyophthirius multifiliis]|uniref:Uncharacterized protein n=1 Tax=Ichthyophthirius multifiliis TaxID=5932 RepID=G0QSU1_ICHMU|nr:hypothetical protein IMG5_103520 [Ichthyophthirius multifiliis]EGR31708.1 hypothetical protein IMG5_103520 [Ichthyophthirius multifiliis]|eukprot:XP_004035194.1 hypothetical protein IMG5_103520 [Ichthyophthirius multifiliis]
MNQSQRQNFKLRIKKIKPKLQDVINYLKEHPHLLRYEKNPYTAERLMMLLDNEKLAALEDEFNEHPDGIELANFIWLMKCAIIHPVDEKYELVCGLIKLFQDIDINGDKHMEWSEFTQYIIDAVIGENDMKFFDQQKPENKEVTETEIIDKAYQRSTKKYILNKFFDNSNHQNLIKKIVYMSSIDSLLCLEQSADFIQLYDSFCRVKISNQNKVQLNIPEKIKRASFIIDFTIAEDINTIAAITNKKQIIFWDSNVNQKFVKTFKLTDLQTGIWYLPLHKLWITADEENNLKTWYFIPSYLYIDSKHNKLKFDKILKFHSKKITDVCELNQPKIIVSSSLDGFICLWDIQDQEPRLLADLRDPISNSRGIRQLAYQHSYGSILISVGFEQYINLWCPKMSITRAYIGKLEGHSSLVILCKFITNSPNIVSIDDKCNIRIWDIRTLQTIQVISADGSYILITDISFVSHKQNDRIILGGKRLTYLENQEKKKTLNIIMMTFLLQMLILILILTKQLYQQNQILDYMMQQRVN